MSKLFYLLLAILCLSCTAPNNEEKMPSIKGMRSLGIIGVDDLHEHKVYSFHDDEQHALCYVVVPPFDSEAYSLSCVKNDVASPK